MEIAAMAGKIAALTLVGGVFVYGLKKDWEGVYLLFGIVFLMGSCKMMGVQ